MLTMEYYSYLVEHDYGLAPNPFGAYCTLSVCKPKIRSSSKLALGDWVVGTGSKALEDFSGRKLRGHLIYAMKVSERISMNEYWNNPRFQYKKPVVNGPLATMYGDNFYHQDEAGNWIQENSAHSNEDGTPNMEHLEIDTGGENVLVATEFYYFGDSAPSLPQDLLGICHAGIGQKKLSHAEGGKLIHWLKANFEKGIHGDPINWIQYGQLELFE